MGHSLEEANIDIGRPFQRMRQGTLQLPAAARPTRPPQTFAHLKAVQTTLFGQQESLLALESHLLSCINTGRVFLGAERGRREVPLSRSNRQSERDRKYLTSTEAK